MYRMKSFAFGNFLKYLLFSTNYGTYKIIEFHLSKRHPFFDKKNKYHIYCFPCNNY